MQLTNIPSKFNIPFGDSAGSSFIRTIPQTPSGTPGQASLQTGFPPENFEPVSAGGVPPFGADFNGILHQSTAWDRWQAAGVAFPPYDAAFQAAIGGYPQTAIVQSLVELGLLYFSLVDNNVTNPDAGGAGWLIWFRRMTTNVDIYVNGSTGNDSNNGLTPATALATIQAAVNLAWTWPPSQFTVNIHVTDGTYGPVSTPTFGGPNVSITGNVGSPANVIINGGTTANAFALNGPNVLSITGVTVETGIGVSSTLSGFIAEAASTLLVTNCRSLFCQGAPLQSSGGTLVVNNFTFAGNSAWMFWGQSLGKLNIQGTMTISTPVTVTACAFVNNIGFIGSAASFANFVNPTNVTGARYLAQSNGVIDTQAAGASFFPGTSAGSTLSGGQYV